MSVQPAAKRQAPFKIISLESLFGLFGLFSLTAGLVRGDIMPVFWGTAILVGLVLLAMVRRRDWQKHWEELDSRQPPQAASDEPPRS